MVRNITVRYTDVHYQMPIFLFIDIKQSNLNKNKFFLRRKNEKQ